MSLQFILGNSGSGKTETVYRQIISEAGEHPWQNYLILVPEQFTLQTQQKLTGLAPNHAIMNIDILSFKRLAYRVFDELGMNTGTVLEETGKNLVLRKVAEEKKEDLQMLASRISRPGYIDEIKSLISELIQYNVSPEQLEGLITDPSMASGSAAKLHDIAIMYRGFRAFMQDHYITAEEILNLLIPVADRSSIIRDSIIVFDEFTGFTPIQNLLIRRLLTLSRKVYVLLTIDSSCDLSAPYKDEELFAMSRKTIDRLTGMARQDGVTVEKPLLLGNSGSRRFRNAPDLAFLEEHLFRSSGEKWKEEPEHLHMFSCRNPKEELLAAIREICRLVREEGYRYREIALVSGSVESYSPYAAEIFDRYQVPYFLDRTTEVVFHPFTECLRSLLEIITDDFSYPSVMRFLRSGFSEIPEEQIDHLDNYLLASGVRGKRAWQRKWLRQPKEGGQKKEKEAFDMEEIDQLRTHILGIFDPLLALSEKKSCRVSELVMAYYRVICALHMQEQLSLLSEEALEEGHQVLAEEDRQLYRTAMELLEKTEQLLGPEHMKIQEFSDLLDAGLSAAKVASIPPGFDCVTIGDIERTRLNHVKVLFIVGVNEGIIPLVSNGGSILSEFERDEMKKKNIELAPGSREQAFIQQFYLYRNLTKPAGHLYLSWARTDTEGKTLRASSLIESIRFLFPALHQEEFRNLSAECNLSTQDAALEYLVHGKADEAWYALAACFLKDSQNGGSAAGKLSAMLKARYARLGSDPISCAAADAIYGTDLKISVTRLEKFASCAYAHFLQYGLGLQERKLSGFENTDIGNLYHDALRNYGLILEKSPWDWFTVEDEQREAFAKEAFEKAILENSNVNIYTDPSGLQQTRRMERIFQQTVWALTGQVRAGRFVPSGYEISFDEISSREDLKMTLDQRHTMELYGRIDRLDLCRDPHRVMVKVIDYKSGREDFDLVSVYEGLTLQLVVYSSAADAYIKRENPQLETVTGAILYYNIDDPLLKPESGEEYTEAEINDMILEALRPAGLVNSEEEVYRALDAGIETRSKVIPLTLKKDGSISDRGSRVADTEEFHIIQDYVRGCMEDAGKAIYQGRIDINPYSCPQKDSCGYCPYDSICGIHSRLEGGEVRKLPSMKKEEIIEAMKIQNAVHESCRKAEG